MTTPYWDVDRPWGEAGQEYVKEVFSWPAASKIEVKRKRRIDEWIYVELEQNPFGKGWRPSGLAVTQAELWAWVVAGTGAMFICRADMLRAALGCDRPWIRKAREDDGECPTRGKLIEIPRMLAWVSNVYGLGPEAPSWTRVQLGRRINDLSAN